MTKRKATEEATASTSSSPSQKAEKYISSALPKFNTHFFTFFEWYLVKSLL